MISFDQRPMGFYRLTIEIFRLSQTVRLKFQMGPDPRFVGHGELESFSDWHVIFVMYIQSFPGIAALLAMFLALVAGVLSFSTHIDRYLWFSTCQRKQRCCGELLESGQVRMVGHLPRDIFNRPHQSQLIN